MRSICRTLVALCFALFALPVPLVAQFRSPQGFVNDFAGVLDPSSRLELESMLRETEQSTSAELVVVTVPSLDGMTVEEYAARLFQQWGIGKRQRDNGVLVLVSPADRAMRIEVGYGLEPILPDGLAGEIIRNDFLPAFRNADFARGIRRGVGRVVDVVRNGEIAPPTPVVESSDDSPPWWLITPFLGLFVAAGSFGVGLGAKSKTAGPILWGGLFAGGPLFMAGLFGPALWILAPLGAGMMAWGYSKGRSQYWADTLRGKSSGADTSDAWVMGGTSSSSSSGDGGSSSSDFGGGSSGGGGASGHW